MRNVDLYAGDMFARQLYNKKLDLATDIRISPNTKIRDCAMYLFGNKIAEWGTGHELFFNLCGWGTLTTRARLDGILLQAKRKILFPPVGYRMYISQRNHEQWIDYCEYSDNNSRDIRVSQRVPIRGFFSPWQFAKKASLACYDLRGEHKEQWTTIKFEDTLPVVYT